MESDREMEIERESAYVVGIVSLVGERGERGEKGASKFHFSRLTR